MPSNLKAGKDKRVWVILLFLAAFLLRLRTPDQAEEALIVPDGVECAVSAVHLLEGKGYTVTLLRKDYPPRAPFGYSLSLVPFYALFGKSLGNGILCTLFFSLASLVLLFFLAKHLFGEGVAFWAAVLSTFSPLHLYWSRQVMADIPFSFFNLLCLWILFCGKSDRKSAFLGGLCAGMGCWFKYSQLFFLIPYVLLLLWRGKTAREKSAYAALFLAGTLFSIFPLLGYNQATFGNFWKTGFSFWTPEWTPLQRMFSPSYVFGIPPFPESKPLANIVVISRFFLGLLSPWTQNPYPFFISPFVGVGLWRIVCDIRFKEDRSREFSLFVFFTALFYSLFFIFLFSQRVRQLLPIVLPLTLIAAVGFDSFFEKWPVLLQRGTFFLLGCALLGGVLAIWKVDRKEPVRKSYFEMIQRHTEESALIVTAWDPVSFYHEIQKDSKRRYMPLSGWVDYVYMNFREPPQKQIPFLVADIHIEAFKERVLTGRPTYVDSLSCQKYPEACALLKKTFAFREVVCEGKICLFSLRDR